MNRYEHETIWASLDEIRIGERTVARLSTATIELYRVWLEQGREAPPVRLARHGDEFVVRDGRHRVAAALAAGHRFIEAEVRPIARLIRRLSAIARSPSDGRRRSERGDEVLPEEHLACTEEEWVRLPPSPCSSGLRSVNGKHTPFVRMRCGFDSCRRLCFTAYARSSADSSAALRGQRALVRIQPGVLTRT